MTAEGQQQEEERLAALRALRILDTQPEPEFDAITAMARRLFDMPVCLVSLVDADRQWFKSRAGVEITETPRDIAFCAHAIAGNGLFEITNPCGDPRFRDSPLVTGGLGIRYYAGIPLQLQSGHKVGTLCLIDTAPRAPLQPDQVKILQELANLVVMRLELGQLRGLERLSSAITAATPDAVIASDLDGTIRQWNPAAEAMFGYTAAEAIGAGLDIIIPHAMRQAHHRGMERLGRGGRPRLLGSTVEVEALHKDGRTFAIEISIAAWRGEGGDYAGYGAIIRDLTARKALEAERARAERFAATVVENLPAALFVKDVETRKYLVWNQAAEEATGWRSEHVIGRSDGDLFEQGDQYAERDRMAIGSSTAQLFESSFLRPDGEQRILRTRRVGMPDEAGRLRYLLGISEDVTEWRRAQDGLAFMAGHDPLTRLANRGALVERLNGEIAAGRTGALIALDLDRFGIVNDQHGRGVGDMLLMYLATLLRELAQEDDVAARIGGDEFALLMRGDGGGDRAARIAHQLVERLNAPLDLGSGAVRTAASVGIALVDANGATTDDVQAKAALALTRAKQSGGARYCFFDPAMDADAQERRRIEAMLPQALNDGQLVTWFQPIACTERGRIIGLEALARWRHPDHGMIAPDRFISVAEECGLIGQLGEALLRQAFRVGAHWPEPLRLFVNLSPWQVEDPSFAASFQAIAEQEAIDPARIDVEVTEGVLSRSPAQVLATLQALKALGTRVAMDDFGTGYSSLSYFSRFPFDKVKIDRSFVKDVTESAEARAIVRTVIGLAGAFKMQVVAEGVETEAQAAFLQAEGCTLMQGWRFGRPAPIEAFEGVLLPGNSGIRLRKCA